MYVVIRRFNRTRSVAEAARRAESGIGQLLKQSLGFQGHHVFDASDGLGGSVTTSNPDHRHPGWSGSSHLHRAFCLGDATCRVRPPRQSQSLCKAHVDINVGAR